MQKWAGPQPAAYPGDTSWMAKMRRLERSLAFVGILLIPLFVSVFVNGAIQSTDRGWDHRILTAWMFFFLFAFLLRVLSSHPSQENPYFQLGNNLGKIAADQLLQRANNHFPWALVCLTFSLILLGIAFAASSRVEGLGADCFVAGIFLSYPGLAYSHRYYAAVQPKVNGKPIEAGS